MARIGRRSWRLGLDIGERGRHLHGLRHRTGVLPLLRNLRGLLVLLVLLSLLLGVVLSLLNLLSLLSLLGLLSLLSLLGLLLGLLGLLGRQHVRLVVLRREHMWRHWVRHARRARRHLEALGHRRAWWHVWRLHTRVLDVRQFLERDLRRLGYERRLCRLRRHLVLRDRVGRHVCHRERPLRARRRLLVRHHDGHAVLLRDGRGMLRRGCRRHHAGTGSVHHRRGSTKLALVARWEPLGHAVGRLGQGSTRQWPWLWRRRAGRRDKLLMRICRHLLE